MRAPRVVILQMFNRRRYLARHPVAEIQIRNEEAEPNLVAPAQYHIFLDGILNVRNTGIMNLLKKKYIHYFSVVI